MMAELGVVTDFWPQTDYHKVEIADGMNTA
jgi:hypothetical protein